MKYSIKRRLQAVFLLFVVLGAVNAAIFYFYVSRIRSYQNTLNQVDKLRVLVLETNKFQNDFLTFDARSNEFMETGISRNLMQHNQHVEEIKKMLADFQQNSIFQRIGAGAEIPNVKLAYEEYSRLFLGLSDLVKQRGFKDYGLEGNMRKAIRELESKSSISKVDILMLRRHEKDFFLRKDTTYVRQLHDLADNLRTGTVTDKELLESYITDFDKIVVVDKRIGLDEASGDRGRIFALMQEINTKVTALQLQIDGTIKGLTQEAIVAMTIASILLLVTAVVFGLTFAHRFSKPIITLDEVATSVMTEGIKGQEVALDGIRSQDEIGSLARDFKLMLGQLKGQMGEIDRQNEQLKRVTEQESKRLWRSEGLTKVTDILRQSNTGLISKLNEAIFIMVRHLEAYQGAVYLLKENTEVQEMELSAHFAAKKQEIKVVRYGEGMIGEAWRKKEMMILKDIQIPEQYAKIAPGLGYATPKTLLIMPVMVEELVLGIIEIASLRDIEEHEMEFLKRSGQQLGMNLILAKVGELNRRMMTMLKQNKINFPTPEFIAGASHEE
ncbi:MAG: GAF domain-containing protein, partial [Verrucomicrobia bacterium]|nr:GAF domain-containing protein [Cytophagales bacterium]